MGNFGFPRLVPLKLGNFRAGRDRHLPLEAPTGRPVALGRQPLPSCASPPVRSIAEINGAFAEGRVLPQRRLVYFRCRRHGQRLEEDDVSRDFHRSQSGGTPIGDLIRRDFGAVALDHGNQDVVLAKLRRGERVDHFDTVRRRKTGELINISLTVSPVRSHDGTIVGASKIARDVSERKEREAERARLLNDAEAAIRAKDNFLAMFGHELRNPLAAVASAADVIAMAHTVDELTRPLDVIGRQVAHLRRLIENHQRLTGSEIATRILANWEFYVRHEFAKVTTIIERARVDD